jgi:hypothetical protein
VIAVFITIMVLELEAPEEATFSALMPLWPDGSTIVVAASAPRAGFALICCALLPYLRPEPPGTRL